MASVTEHYELHLAEYYSWMFGGLDKKCQENKGFFVAHDIKPIAEGRAVDLGCGSGFQAIPLAQIGFKVTGIDLSSKLLLELEANKGYLPIKLINDDLINFDIHCHEPLELIICMGDTLTHLDSLEIAEKVIEKAYKNLEEGGYLVLTFRDLTFELEDLERFIPVNSSENTIFTCFLEYENDRVKVHDIIYENLNGKWQLKKSYYKKLRMSKDWTINKLKEIGFTINHCGSEKGVITLIARNISNYSSHIA